PEAFVSARAAAQQKADSLGPRIPELIIAIDGVEPGTPVTIKVDGEALRADIPRRLVNPAPWDHLVSASAPGYKETSVTASAKEGEQKPVTLHLDRGAGATTLDVPPPTTTSTTPPPPTVPPPAPDRPGKGGVNVAAM